jgi:hypothetical protein
MSAQPPRDQSPPPYGQPPYGQPPYDSPPGYPPYGSPPYDSPPGYPPYGSPPYDSPPGYPPYGPPPYDSPPGYPPYGSPPYGPPPGYPPYGPPPYGYPQAYRQPFIVGRAFDKVAGFLVGFFANVLGLVGTIAVMYIWAGSDQRPDVPERREHAKSVSIWSGVGCLVPLVLWLLLGFVLIATLSSRPGWTPDFAQWPGLP